MEYELPTDFDIIIIGTGVVESVIAAAASRVGKKVLHIDSNYYYGGLWASFNLEAIQQLNNAIQPTIESEFNNELLVDDEKIRTVGNNLFNLKDFTVEWHIPEKLEKEPKQEGEIVEENMTEKKVLTQNSLLKNSRKFNIDLTPKLQFARGDFVELLISSNIARYSEYRSVSRVLTWLNGQLEIVPCSRSDVFTNNKVSVIEKRMLMKLFTSLNGEEQKAGTDDNKTFETFLKERKLSPSLIHYVLFAISMSTNETSCLQGIENTKRFLNSLGRFGKTPFLFSMYGSGEVTQAFCRLSAVFGGIYALKQPLKGLIFDKNDTFKGLICGKQRINAEYLVMSAEKSPVEFVKTIKKSYISRAIFITDRSIMDSDKEHLTLLLYPTQNGSNLCVILELGTLTGTSPKDLYIVHMISRQINNPKDDFQDCVKNVFDDSQQLVTEKPNILWSSYFSIPDSNNSDLKSNAPNNVYICPGPDLNLDYDLSIKKAKHLFNEIYPEQEFLPRAPDPEEIITEGDEKEAQETTETATENEVESTDVTQEK